MWGVSSAPAIFQCSMEKKLGNMRRVSVYIHDVIIGGKDFEECMSNVRLVLEKLNKYNIRVNIDKCVFFFK
ncbi:MAG: reverse transcriptase domain-containing protein [Janthinobacterium lividum]